MIGAALSLEAVGPDNLSSNRKTVQLADCAPAWIYDEAIGDVQLARLDPMSAYLAHLGGVAAERVDLKSAKVEVSKAPSHGLLFALPPISTEVGRREMLSFWYVPDRTFEGEDSAVLLLQVDGVRVTVTYSIVVFSDTDRSCQDFDIEASTLIDD